MSNGLLGAVLFVAAGATLVGLVGVGQLVDRWGSDRVTRPVVVAVPVALTGLGLAPDVPVLIVALLAIGVSGGLLNVGMNAQAIRIEREYGRSIMTSFHACYSLGGLTGAGLGAWCASNAITPALAFSVLGSTLAVVAGFVGSALLPDDRGDAVVQQRPRRDWRRDINPGVVMLGLCAFACLFAEGVTADWSALYLRTSLDASAEASASGFVAFSLSMAIGRLWGDALTRRVPVKLLVRVGAVLAAAGYGLALSTSAWLLAVLAIGIFGLGLSCITPQIFRAAGNDSEQVGRALSIVATLGYAGLLSGPALIGSTSQVVGLRTALVLVVILMLAVLPLYRPVLRA
jgi:predicted MFS family arabinose efflux permease